MKENFEKAKEFVKDHKCEIVLTGIIGCATVTGFIFGQWSVLSDYKTFTGMGCQAMVDYIRVNGLEAAEEMVKNAYKIK